MIGRRIALTLIVGLACFVLGLGAARMFGGSPVPATRAAEPRIVVDPSSIDLLPDASLRLRLPPPLFDAGTP